MMVFEVNDKFDYQIELTDFFGELSDSDKEDLDRRGEKVIEKNPLANASPSREVMMMKKGKNKIIVIVGENITGGKYGSYERQRSGRAYFQLNNLIRNDADYTNIDSTDIALGEIEFREYMVTGGFKRTDILGVGVYLRQYEGILNDKEIITILTAAITKEEDEKFEKMIKNSKFTKK